MRRFATFVGGGGTLYPPSDRGTVFSFLSACDSGFEPGTKAHLSIATRVICFRFNYIEKSHETVRRLDSRSTNYRRKALCRRKTYICVGE